MIGGVYINRLIKHADERGFFCEVIRYTDEFFKEGFGQLSHSSVNKGVIKGWHGHKYQTQWNYIATGLIKVVLYDSREDSKTHGEIMEFLMGEKQDAKIYSFPPGVLHGYKCINGPMNIIYVTSGTYDLDDEVSVELSMIDCKF
jgi:dTDP-4-dehydrorhamnose 3,5-epimerase